MGIKKEPRQSWRLLEGFNGKLLDKTLGERTMLSLVKLIPQRTKIRLGQTKLWSRLPNLPSHLTQPQGRPNKRIKQQLNPWTNKTPQRPLLHMAGKTLLAA